MRILTLTSKDKLKPAIITKIAGSLGRGEVVALPTDTIYGLSCLALSDSAVRLLCRLKNRERKPVILLVSSLKMAEQYVDMGKMRQLALKYWNREERPTTLIFRAKKEIPHSITQGKSTVALRLPKSRFLIKIIDEVGQPIVSTSLNLSGMEPVSDPKAFRDQFGAAGEELSLFVWQPGMRKKKPSRLLDMSGRRPKVIRE